MSESVALDPTGWRVRWGRPNWDFWANVPAAELWQAVLLSLEADFAPGRHFIQKNSLRVHSGVGSALTLPEPPDFFRRINIAIAHFSADGTVQHKFTEWERIARQPVNLVDFATLATKWGFALPPRFPRAAPSDAPMAAKIPVEKKPPKSEPQVDPAPASNETPAPEAAHANVGGSTVGRPMDSPERPADMTYTTYVEMLCALDDHAVGNLVTIDVETAESWIERGYARGDQWREARAVRCAFRELRRAWPKLLPDQNQVPRGRRNDSGELEWDGSFKTESLWWHRTPVPSARYWADDYCKLIDGYAGRHGEPNAIAFFIGGARWSEMRGSRSPPMSLAEIAANHGRKSATWDRAGTIEAERLEEWGRSILAEMDAMRAAEIPPVMDVTSETHEAPAQESKSGSVATSAAEAKNEAANGLVAAPVTEEKSAALGPTGDDAQLDPPDGKVPALFPAVIEWPFSVIGIDGISRHMILTVQGSGNSKKTWRELVPRDEPSLANPSSVEELLEHSGMRFPIRVSNGLLMALTRKNGVGSHQSCKALSAWLDSHRIDLIQFSFDVSGVPHIARSYIAASRFLLDLARKLGVSDAAGALLAWYQPERREGMAQLFNSEPRVPSTRGHVANLMIAPNEFVEAGRVLLAKHAYRADRPSPDWTSVADPWLPFPGEPKCCAKARGHSGDCAPADPAPSGQEQPAIEQGGSNLLPASQEVGPPEVAPPASPTEFPPAPPAGKRPVPPGARAFVQDFFTEWKKLKRAIANETHWKGVTLRSLRRAVKAAFDGSINCDGKDEDGLKQPKTPETLKAIIAKMRPPGVRGRRPGKTSAA